MKRGDILYAYSNVRAAGFLNHTVKMQLTSDVQLDQVGWVGGVGVSRRLRVWTVSRRLRPGGALPRLPFIPPHPCPTPQRDGSAIFSVMVEASNMHPGVAAKAADQRLVYKLMRTGYTILSALKSVGHARGAARGGLVCRC